MAHANVVTWTCDRCGKKVELETGSSPEDWQLVQIVNLDESKEKHWEICPSCHNQVERFLQNGTEVADREVARAAG